MSKIEEEEEIRNYGKSQRDGVESQEPAIVLT